MDLGKARAVITGAGGFIGSHLTEMLVRCCPHVRALVRYNGRGDRGMLEVVPKDVLDSVEVVAGDVCDPFAVRSLIEGADVVFHLAALIAIPYSYVAPASYMATNVNGTLNVLQACRDLNVSRLAHTSTSEAYGTALYTPIDEAHPLQGQSPYSASKIAADKLAESYYRSFELPVVTVRPFNTFGPRQSARAVVPTIISQALAGGGVKLGSLDPKRDMTYVTDTCEGFCALAECDEAVGKVVNLGTGRTESIGDIVAAVGRILGGELDVQVDPSRVRPQKSEVMVLQSDNSLCRELTRWQPAYSLEDGLREVVAHIRDNLARYRTDIYNV